MYTYCRKDSLNVSKKNFVAYFQDCEIHQIQALPKARRIDFLYGRFLLKKTLQQILNTSAEDFAVVYIDSKPAVIHKGTIYYCSLTHSTNYVGCAVSTTSWPGIDVEEVKSRSNEFLNYIANPQELKSLLAFFLDVHIGTIIWNIKEAAFKADPKQRMITDYTIISYQDGIANVLNKVTKCYFVVRHHMFEDTTRALVV
jgi:4'-phosphopantetheinyl transferase EntD